MHPLNFPEIYQAVRERQPYEIFFLHVVGDPLSIVSRSHSSSEN